MPNNKAFPRTAPREEDRSPRINYIANLFSFMMLYGFEAADVVGSHVSLLKQISY